MNGDVASLNRLHDIVTPAPAPWWPPAPGWYWILAFILILTLGYLAKSLLRWQHNRYRREAMAEFARQESVLNDPTRRAAALEALADLLKRAALTAWRREEVAALTGPEWFAFLDYTGGTTVFSGGHGVILERAVFDPRTVAALDEAKAKKLAASVKHWLRHHRVEQTGGME